MLDGVAAFNQRELLLIRCLFTTPDHESSLLLSSLTQPLTRYPSEAMSVSPGQDFTGIDVISLRAAVGKVPDPRAKRGVRYSFTELLLLVIVCAVFSGRKL